MFIITLLVNDLYSASISARRSLLSGCTLLIASSKRRASLPLSTGVSAISRAVIKYVFKLNIRCKDTKKYCNYAPIRKKIFFEERILRSFEVLMPHQSVIMPPSTPVQNKKSFNFIPPYMKTAIFMLL